MQHCYTLCGGGFFFRPRWVLKVNQEESCINGLHLMQMKVKVFFGVGDIKIGREGSTVGQLDLSREGEHLSRLVRRWGQQVR